FLLPPRSIRFRPEAFASYVPTHKKPRPISAIVRRSEPVWAQRILSAPRRQTGSGYKGALSERDAYGQPVEVRSREFAPGPEKARLTARVVPKGPQRLFARPTPARCAVIKKR